MIQLVLVLVADLLRLDSSTVYVSERTLVIRHLDYLHREVGLDSSL